MFMSSKWASQNAFNIQFLSNYSNFWQYATLALCYQRLYLEQHHLTLFNHSDCPPAEEEDRQAQEGL